MNDPIESLGARRLAQAARKAREIGANPQVALLFHWPELGRQAHVYGYLREEQELDIGLRLVISELG